MVNVVISSGFTLFFCYKNDVVTRVKLIPISLIEPLQSSYFKKIHGPGNEESSCQMHNNVGADKPLYLGNVITLGPLLVTECLNCKVPLCFVMSSHYL